ncbi:hypothetical protein ACIHEI_36680 [Kitasatospora sp. NPDC051984]|uniref:hypothetical protein n=1 Tax=Kitasatospora sp. NPDC051984 TaxID=3364059 RepID=UPI0037C6A497
MNLRWVRCALCAETTAYVLDGDPVEELLAAGRGHAVQHHPGQTPDDVLDVLAETVRLPHPVPTGQERQWLATHNEECLPGIPAAGA